MQASRLLRHLTTSSSLRWRSMETACTRTSRLRSLACPLMTARTRRSGSDSTAGSSFRMRSSSKSPVPLLSTLATCAEGHGLMCGAPEGVSTVMRK